MKLEAQQRAGPRVTTGCTKSSPISAVLREPGLLSLADHADINAARLHETALQDRQDTLHWLPDGQRKLLDGVTRPE